MYKYVEKQDVEKINPKAPKHRFDQNAGYKA
jgi:hypothetical protein